MVAVLGMMPLSSMGETISVIGPAGGEVIAGDSLTALVMISDSTEALVGYTVDVRVVPLAGATGTITRDLVNSNFGDPQNLIDASGTGEARHSPLSFIGPSAGGGVFFNAVTASLETIPGAAAGVNDILGEAWFTVSGDASGQFRIELGPSTALAGEGFDPIPFESVSTTVTVVPEPAAVLLAGLGALTLFRGRRRHA